MADNTFRVISSDSPQVNPAAAAADHGERQSESPIMKAAECAPQSERLRRSEANSASAVGAKAPAGNSATLVMDARMARVERQNRWFRYGFALLAVLLLWDGYHKVFPEGVTIHKTILESKELKLLDADGNPRLFLRMYSRVPVLQVMDSKGKPRMSLGLRFDDSPFIDLADQSGRTRATLEITEHDAPALRLFDEQGAVKFQIN